MTYDEARAAMTILMVADGLPAPDFSDDSKYAAIRHTTPMHAALYWLSKPHNKPVDYSGEIRGYTDVAFYHYIKWRENKKHDLW